MANEELREYIVSHGVYQYRIADVLGLHETAFSRKLRKELPEAEKQQIMKIVDGMRDK